VNAGRFEYACGGYAPQTRRQPALMNQRFVLVLGLAMVSMLSSVPAYLTHAQTDQPRDVGHGKQLFLRYCAGCHGEDGRGEAKTFRPNVANLSVKELMDQLTDDYLFATIKNGGAAVGKNAAMPAWKNQLDDGEIWDVVSFIRTLAKR
jgi:mono/diheme cytochrome c family protein